MQLRKMKIAGRLFFYFLHTDSRWTLAGLFSAPSEALEQLSLI